MDIPDEMREHLENGHCGNPMCHGCNFLAMVQDLKDRGFTAEETMQALLIGVGQIYDIGIEMFEMPGDEEALH